MGLCPPLETRRPGHHHEAQLVINALFTNCWTGNQDNQHCGDPPVQLLIFPEFFVCRRSSCKQLVHCDSQSALSLCLGKTPQAQSQHTKHTKQHKASGTSHPVAHRLSTYCQDKSSTCTTHGPCQLVGGHAHRRSCRVTTMSTQRLPNPPWFGNPIGEHANATLSEMAKLMLSALIACGSTMQHEHYVH